MLGHDPFYFQHFKNYVILFGTLFNDISIVRKDKDGNTKLIKVPISFVNREKAYNKLLQDPDLELTWNSSFPRMSFEMTDFQYASTRKENTMNYTKMLLDGTMGRMQYSPVPYDIGFNLSIFTNYFEDGLQIVEQILPFFQPEYTVSVNEVPDLDIKRDVQVVLNSVTMSDDVEGDFDGQRLIEWTLSFMVKGFVYGPIIERKKILNVDASIYNEHGFELFNYNGQANPTTNEITENTRENI